jgi:hypothetical protein
MRKTALLCIILLAFMLSLTASIAIAEVGEMDDNGQHWCMNGERWDDGRCNDPDPWISEWHWTCGWYFANYTSLENVPTWCGGGTPATVGLLVDTCTIIFDGTEGAVTATFTVTYSSAEIATIGPAYVAGILGVNLSSGIVWDLLADTGSGWVGNPLAVGGGGVAIGGTCVLPAASSP